MAATTSVPLEIYLHSEYEPDAEYVEGEIEERPMGEDSHSAWQFAIAQWFGMHAEQWGVRIRPELRVQTGAARFRVPDIAILDASLPREPVATHAPLAVFEILSPEDRYKRVMVKLREYAEMGVAAIFVVDPDTGVFERFEQGQLVRREEFCLVERGVEFQFAEIAKLVM